MISSRIVSLMVGLSLSSAALAEAAFPSRADVEANMLAKICSQLTVNVTDLNLGQKYPAVKIPVCVDVAANYPTDALVQVSSDPNFTVFHAAPASDLVDVSAGSYTFRALLAHDSRTTIDPAVLKYGLYSPAKAEPMEMGYSAELISNWDLRLTKILAANAGALPVQFTTMILPPLTATGKNGALELQAHALWTGRGAPSTATGSLDVRDLHGLAYDANGWEYDVAISVDPQDGTLVFRQ